MGDPSVGRWGVYIEFGERSVTGCYLVPVRPDVFYSEHGDGERACAQIILRFDGAEDWIRVEPRENYT